MDGLNGLRAFGDLCLDQSGVDIVGIGFNIDKNGSRTEPRNCANGRKKAVRRGDNFIARADIKGHHRQKQSVAARSASDGVFRPAITGKLTFELRNLTAEDECIGIEHPPQSRFYLRPKPGILFTKIK